MTVIACDVLCPFQLSSGFCRNQRVGTVSQCRQFFCKKPSPVLPCKADGTCHPAGQPNFTSASSTVAFCTLPSLSTTTYSGSSHAFISRRPSQSHLFVVALHQYDCHLTGALVASGVEYNKRNCVFAIFFKYRSICQVCNISGSILRKGYGQSRWNGRNGLRFLC